MCKVNMSKKGFGLLFILAIAIFVDPGCALTRKIYYGQLRKGYITDMRDSTVVVTLGKKNGISVGEELNVYKITIISRPKPQCPLCKSVCEGRIRITKIIGDYHSMAIIVSGQVRENYKVEFPRA